ncbi:MAG: serine hydrolase [Bacteroidetes bacterium]|nr:serine hydrolase [Bacteroidota bacterium]
MKKLLFPLFLAVILHFNVSLSAQVHPAKLEFLDLYYQKAMENWNVPGMAIAIVSKDSVLFVKGFGVIDIYTKQAVDENTLFAVASNTKAITAAALAMLVDQGKISWNDKVVKHLPYFALYDPYVTQNMTIRDLLTHRSGLKTFAGDLIWYGSTYTREDIIRKARYLKPTYGFREQFGYSNLMYITAGEIVPAVTGMSWDDFIRQNFMQPLGMERSTLHVSELAMKDNVAQPHTYVDGKLKPIPWMDWDNMGPAGSLISSASEMASWLQMNLNNGSFNGKSMISAACMFEMQSPNTINNVTQASLRRFPSTHFKSYGLGWSLMDYLGRKVVSHNGGYDGMISQTLFIPEENIGFVILTNSLSSLYYPLMYQTLDVLLDNPVEKDWSAEILPLIKSGEESQKKEYERLNAERVKNTKHTLKLNDYTGFYGCPLYDSIQVREENGKLMLEFMRSPDFLGTMVHWHHDTFEIEFQPLPSLPKGFVTFRLDRNGKVESMEIFLDNPDFDFTEFDLKKL